MTNEQCRSRWNKLILQGKIINDDTPNLSYDYDEDEDVEKAFINQRKKGYRERIIWSPEMV